MAMWRRTWRPLDLFQVDPFRPDENRLFQTFTNGGWPWREFGQTSTFPALNIWESENALHVEAELPGLKMDEIEITVMGNELTLKGAKKETGDEHISYHRRERGVGSFHRVVRLPAETDTSRVEARLLDGVLSILLPKAEKARPRRIEVKLANA